MSGFQVGIGLADVTGEAADCGMLGYGKAEQRTAGIHTRLRARAFVFVDESDRRFLLVVAEIPLVFESVRAAVLTRLAVTHDGLYGQSNVMITATHTHCGPGGYSHHALYNSTTGGFRPRTFGAIVDGICKAVEEAHADVAPASLTLVHGELRNASVNRSRSAFDLNPDADRAHFPEAIDPQTTVLSIRRGDRLVGVVNWFATHNTSMTNGNVLISSDNKGYAALHWEQADYLADERPALVTAFAQTNAGDMSPNLRLAPGRGPTDDEVENTRIIGLRQYDAASGLVCTGEPLTGGLDHRLTYVNLSDVQVSPEFTPDGKPHRTGAPAPGAAAIAGAGADGKGFAGFREGSNPVFDLASKLLYRLSPRLADAQSPKGIVVSGAFLNRLVPAVAEQLPVQLVRLGHLYLIGIPGEVTIVAGLRLRRTVAAIVGADLEEVLVAGYSNGYLHYVTTPEEYVAQRYEGGSTLFGRWELPALQQIAARLAVAMVSGDPVPVGDVPTPLEPKPGRGSRRTPVDRPADGRSFGDVLTEPAADYVAGERAVAEFVGANPNNVLRDTYAEVQRRETDGTWTRIADDGDWSTRFHWEPGLVRVIWHVPEDAEGAFRLVYRGDSAEGAGHAPRSFVGVSSAFEVRAPSS